MKILIVGALSWNPERMRSLHEHGHELWGLWSRSMAWDEGPYPMLEGCVRSIALDDAADIVSAEGIDCIYALYQVYPRALWGPPGRGIEHDIWTMLRRLFDDRANGRFEAPIVFHWGFDVHELDLGIAAALDGQILCNRHQLDWWTAPRDAGGCELAALAAPPVLGFLDGDRPKQEFMRGDFAEPLSRRTGEIHTLCAGRPLGIDLAAAARAGIHVHVYDNGFDRTDDLVADQLARVRHEVDARALREHVHLHPSLQPAGRSWAEVQAAKSQWVAEFSQYDAGWSYIGRPFAWPPLQDRAAIPSRAATYALAGLPVITDAPAGHHRRDVVGPFAIEFDRGGDGEAYAALRTRLQAEARSGELRETATRVRTDYSFDAAIPALIEMLQAAREEYFARPAATRRRSPASEGPRQRLWPGSTGATRARLRRRVRRLAGAARRRLQTRRAGRLLQDLDAP